MKTQADQPSAVGRGMPFSRENIKFTVLTIAFVLMVITGVVGVAAVSRSNSPHTTPAIATIIGFVSLQAGNFLLLLRTEQAHVEIAKTRHDIKEPLQATATQGEYAAKKLDQVDQKLDEAKQRLDVTGRPISREEMEGMLREMREVEQRVVKACEKLSGNG